MSHHVIVVILYEYLDEGRGETGNGERGSKRNRSGTAGRGEGQKWQGR